MKCPKCGAYNKPDYKKCYVCNATLPQEYIVGENKKQDNKLWTQAAFREGAQRKTKLKKEDEEYNFDLSAMESEEDIIEDPKQQEKLNRKYASHAKKEMAKQRGVWGSEYSTKYTRRGEGNIPVVALHDESDEDTTRKRRRGSKYGKSPLSKNAKKIGKYFEGQEIGVVVPPEPPRKVEEKKEHVPKKTTYKKRLNIKWARLILVSVFTACLVFGLIVGVAFLVDKVSYNMSNVFGTRNALPNNGQPLVERSLIDGQTWHTITFYGDDGDKVLIQDKSHNIKETLTIHDNQAVFMVHDYFYIPEADEEFYGDPFTYVDIKAYHFDKNGVETELVIPEYRISIPLAPLTIIHPVEQSTTEEATQVLVKVKVEPNSRVIIDKKNMSGNIDADGYTSTFITLEPEGINTIPILVETDGYRANNYELLVNNPKRDIEIELIKAPTEERNPELRIDGITEPGTTITTDANLLIDEIRVKDDGSFYIKVKLSDFGWNPINLYATAADGRTATLTHNINRIPLEGAYTRSAWVLDYKALATSATKMVGQVYYLPGTIEERIDTPEAKLYKFNTGTGAEPQYLIIEYNGLYDLKVDGRYDAYADVLGKHDNFPLFYARFVYESEDQDGNGIDDDEEDTNVDEEDTNADEQETNEEDTP